MFRGEREYPFLRHGAFDVVVLNDHVLLEDLDGKHLEKTRGDNHMFDKHVV